MVKLSVKGGESGDAASSRAAVVALVLDWISVCDVRFVTVAPITSGNDAVVVPTGSPLEFWMAAAMSATPDDLVLAAHPAGWCLIKKVSTNEDRLVALAEVSVA